VTVQPKVKPSKKISALQQPVSIVQPVLTTIKQAPTTVPVPIILNQGTDDTIHNNTQNVDIDIGKFEEVDEVDAPSIFQQDIDAQHSLLFNEQYWARNVIVPGGTEHLLQVLRVNANEQTVDIKWLTTLTTETLSIEEYEFKSINSISRKRKANHRYH
jgi:hypothetical protein